MTVLMLIHNNMCKNKQKRFYITSTKYPNYKCFSKKSAKTHTEELTEIVKLFCNKVQYI